MSLPVIKVMAEVLPAIIELLMSTTTGEVVREEIGKATVGTHKVKATLTVVSPEMDRLVGLLPMVTMDNSSQLHDSSPRAS